MLWCLVINELLELINSLGYQTEGFSDDLATLIRGKFVRTLCEILQTILNIISQWCLENELQVNPEKTKMIIFTKRRNLDGIIIPKINGISIKIVNQVKYLGIILDSKLSWIPNIESRIEKATIALWQCRKAYGKSWGLSPKVIHWLYTSVIRPILMYGSFLWNHLCNKRRIQDKLNKFQRLACKAITGAWYSTPLAALETMLNLTPLHILIRTEAITTLNRIQKVESCHLRNLQHSMIWFESETFLPEFHMNTDEITPIFRFDRKFNLHIPNKSEWMEGRFPPNEGTIFYTDGSVTKEASGIGVHCVVPQIDENTPIGKFTTIFSAEMLAITQCCDTVANLKISNHTVFICTDSQSTIKALMKAKITSALTLECWDKLNSISSNNKVTLLWIPGHSNIPGNEKADALAKIGATKIPIGPEPIIGITKSKKKHALSEYKHTCFEKFWKNQLGCRQAKNCIRLNKKLSKYLINLSRTRLKLYTGVMTGHFDFNYYLNSIGKRSDPACEFCSARIDSAEHYLCNCPAFILSRYRCLGRHTLSYELIKSLHPRNILDYIKSTGRFREKYNMQ